MSVVSCPAWERDYRVYVCVSAKIYKILRAGSQGRLQTS